MVVFGSLFSLGTKVSEPDSGTGDYQKIGGVKRSPAFEYVIYRAAHCHVYYWLHGRPKCKHAVAPDEISYEGANAAPARHLEACSEDKEEAETKKDPARNQVLTCSDKVS